MTALPARVDGMTETEWRAARLDYLRSAYAAKSTLSPEAQAALAARASAIFADYLARFEAANAAALAEFLAQETSRAA